MSSEELKLLIEVLPCEKIEAINNADHIPNIYAAFYDAITLDSDKKSGFIKKAEEVISNANKFKEFEEAIKEERKKSVRSLIEKNFGENTERSLLLLKLYPGLHSSKEVRDNFSYFCNNFPQHLTFTSEQFTKLTELCLNQNNRVEVTSATLDAYRLGDEISNLFTPENPWDQEKQKTRQRLMANVYSDFVADEVIKTNCTTKYKVFVEGVLAGGIYRRNANKSSDIANLR